MHSKGKWTSRLAWFYYLTGSIYYFWKWIITLGIASLLASGTAWCFSASTITAVFLVISLFLLVLGISFGRKIAKSRLCSLNPGLRVDRIAIDYRLKSESESVAVRAVEAEALFPTDRYQAPFCWTGKGQVTGSPLEGAIKVEVFPHPGNAHDICRVSFGETLPTGSKRNFAYKMQFYGATNIVRPFLGHIIDTPLKELKMRVQLLPNQEIKQYKRQCFINIEADVPLREETVPVIDPDNLLLDWTIHNPQHNFFYRISWDLPGAPYR